MSDERSIFDLGSGASLNEQVAHPGRNTFRPMPKRFYKEAAAAPLGGGFTVLLDGRGVKTPARAPLVVPTRALAEAMAGEWDAQGEQIDPRQMWLTKLANTAVDRVASRRDPVIDEIAAFAGTDLVSYRAHHPDALVERQSAHWDPVIEWAAETFGARLKVTTGVAPIAQDEAALARLRAAIAAAGEFELAALHNAVSLTGSALIGLALLHKRLDALQAFDAAHVDEAWQAELCGEDEDEAQRLAIRKAELLDTARFLELLSDAT
ncbi:MAG: ATP12 family protein [Parvibaculum sp.]|uniref:ATP12 family chaperone protein n=1 Tax=Parvibaculum sp. TaxID=2024848 RepID=UPI00283BE73C|nr:ATP12 family protein [Parvibaculum sp.]MDR3499120.1 ATP12 family protein [Parvibaculum sp.]